MSVIVVPVVVESLEEVKVVVVDVSAVLTVIETPLEVLEA